MINRPYCISKNGTLIPINLGVKVDPFNREDPVFSKAWYDGIVGVKWENDGQEIVFIPNSVNSIDAYPTPCMKYMMVILYNGDDGFRENAICINSRAEIFLKPNLPERLSKMDKKLPKGNLDFFGGCGWSQYCDHMYFYFPIAGTDFRETRFFNCKTMAWDFERYETWRL